MTAKELADRLGPIVPSDLPLKHGPRFGARAFTDEEEEKIFVYVQVQKNPAELAAVQCRTSKATIHTAINRVKARLNENAPAPCTNAGH